MPHAPTRRGAPRKKHPTVALAARFAQQVATLRAERGETQKHLATRLGMTESMISRFESGEHLPSLMTLCRLAEAFDCRLEISFHEHEHERVGGLRHKHLHEHNDSDHVHAHDGKRT